MRQDDFLLIAYCCCVLVGLFTACNPSAESTAEEAAPQTYTIAFGSCAHQDKDQPMLAVAAGLPPDAFVFLGDNIYGDSRIMDTLRAKYGRLAAKPEFQQLKQQTQVFAIWDDHDYGENDSGRHYPFKAESKDIFMDFWEVPQESERRRHAGIYGTEYLKKGDLTIQLILLDTRTFRDELLHRSPEDTLGGHKNDYIPNTKPDSTFLGAAQWQWLEGELTKSADVRIIASSNQFSHEYNGWESWTNVPHEQQRMLDLIRRTKANGVVFISGDVHWGEISKLEVPDGYPIYDVTSSGITETWDVIEGNTHRIGPPVPQNNVGMIEVAKSAAGTQLTLAVVDSTAEAVVRHVVPLEEIRFAQ